MAHHHHHDHGSGGRRDAFRLTVLLNGALSGLQIVVGIAFGSIALIGDALHNLGDVAGLLLGWGAEHLSRRPPTERFSYGFGRSTQLAAVSNAVLILMASAVVCVEAIQRFGRPEPLVAGPVAWAASAGLVVNLVSARLFGHHHQHDLNRRAAVLHLLSDAAVSAAVLLSALLAGATGWTWLDPLTGLGVGLSVAWLGVRLLRDSLAESLDAVPNRIDADAVRETLRSLGAVAGLHHLHIWSMGGSRVALTVHLVRPADHAWNDDRLLQEANHALADLGINHCTIQIESPASPCAREGC